MTCEFSISSDYALDQAPGDDSCFNYHLTETTWQTMSKNYLVDPVNPYIWEQY